MLRQTAKNTGVILGSLILVLLVLEIGIRVFTEPAKTPHDLFCQYHPLLGWTKIPDISATYTTDEYEVKERINSKGIRGPEYPYEKPENEYRILVLGDSFAEGYMVGFDDLFSQVMKKKLNSQKQGAGRKKVQVINAGVGGYSTDQEYLFFVSEGKKYHPDLVVLMFYENDVMYNVEEKHWRGYKPVLTRQNSSMVVKNYPVPKPAASGAVDIPWFAHSKLYTYILNRITLEKTRASIPRVFHVWKRKPDVHTKTAWKATEIILEKLNDAVHAAGAKLLVFSIPSKQAVYLKLWEETKTFYGLSDMEWNVDKAEEDLFVICKKLDIPLILPKERYRMEALSLKKENKRLYYKEDGHWNAPGHELCGKILSGYILREYLQNK